MTCAFRSGRSIPLLGPLCSLGGVEVSRKPPHPQMRALVGICWNLGVLLQGTSPKEDAKKTGFHKEPRKIGVPGDSRPLVLGRYVSRGTLAWCCRHGFGQKASIYADFGFNFSRHIGMGTKELLGVLAALADALSIIRVP